MNGTIVVTTATTNNNLEIMSNNSTVNNLIETHSLGEDCCGDDDDGMSDDSSPQFEDSNELMHATMEDEVTAQLAAAGPVGMAAAAAIASAKKRKRPHQFETNPSIRKRQQTRLLRKLRQTIDEFTIRVGMQAVVLVAIPGKAQNSFKVFGASPLDSCIRNLRQNIIQDLESALAAHAPAPAPEDPTLHELPPLVIDGIPTPVEKMTQAQLRAFIPLMLKYSTGRGKPGWGKESTRPPWWPQDLPWANVRMDARTEDEKQKVSWTHALRQIVINCYKYHGREDLLPVFNADSEESNVDVKPSISKLNNKIVVTTATSTQQLPYTTVTVQSPAGQSSTQAAAAAAQHFQHGTVLQTISNPDGTVSIIQVDPTNSIITLPDGTTAQVQGVLQQSGDQSHHHHHQLLGHHTIQLSSSEEGGGGGGGVTVDMVAQAAQALGQEGQIILTGEDGQAYPVTVSGMITVPVNPNIYQTVVANISGINQSDNMQSKSRSNKKRHIQQTHQIFIDNSLNSNVVTNQNLVLPKIEPGTENSAVETTTVVPISALTGDPTQTQLVTVNQDGHILHNNKLYQICELMNQEKGEKLIMMAEVQVPTTVQLSQEQQETNIISQQQESETTSVVES